MRPVFPRLLLAVSTVIFASCATKQLVPDFAEFSEAYAHDMNWQMLLNLARLDQGHPAYFMAIGEIRLARSESAGISGSGSASDSNSKSVAGTISRNFSNAVSGTLGANASASANPSFVFIPINSEEASRQLLSPIPIDVFNTMYQQGWPADQLLRVLVERIEVDVPENGKTTHLVLVNSPSRGSEESFARFLRVCEIVRALQKEGALNLVPEDRFTPIAGGEATSIGQKEIMEAAEKNRVWQKNTFGNGWQLGTMRQIYRFQARQDAVDKVAATLRVSSAPDYQASLDNLKAVLATTVGTTPTEPGGRTSGTRSVLILRSFRNVLESVASEQDTFLKLMDKTSFAGQVPARQLRPILRTEWKGFPGKLEKPPVKLEYHDCSYQITDPVGIEDPLEARWNRDVFRLLVQLSSQVTVDITKFQRQVIDLSQ